MQQKVSKIVEKEKDKFVLLETQMAGVLSELEEEKKENWALKQNIEEMKQGMIQLSGNQSKALNKELSEMIDRVNLEKDQLKKDMLSSTTEKESLTKNLSLQIKSLTQAAKDKAMEIQNSHQ